MSWGIVVAFAGMIATLFITLMLAKKLDHAWKLVRRAGGYEQKRGALEGSSSSAPHRRLDLRFWFLIIQGPGPSVAPRTSRAVGLLDYYRQFEDMEEEEINSALRARRKREKELALEEVPVIDLSSTEWPDFPHSEVVNASIFVARGRLNGYPDRYATEVRRRLAERHAVAPEQIVVGNGVAELLQARPSPAGRRATSCSHRGRPTRSIR